MDLKIIPYCYILVCGGKKIDAGYGNALAIRSDGTLWSWGKNNWGSLGRGYEGIASYPIGQIGTDNDWKDISVTFHSFAIKSDGTLWGAGETSSKLGLFGANSEYYFLTKIYPEYQWKSVKNGANHVVGITTTGDIYTWGDNRYGQLGINDSVESKSTPQLIFLRASLKTQCIILCINSAVKYCLIY